MSLKVPTLEDIPESPTAEQMSTEPARTIKLKRSMNVLRKPRPEAKRSFTAPVSPTKPAFPFADPLPPPPPQHLALRAEVALFLDKHPPPYASRRLRDFNALLTKDAPNGLEIIEKGDFNKDKLYWVLGRYRGGRERDVLLGLVWEGLTGVMGRMREVAAEREETVEIEFVEDMEEQRRGIAM